MQLIIDGKKAVLKKGSSFDYVSENRAFSDADDYTLSITLPLAGCPGNLDIFGHLDRMDADSRHIVLNASLVDRGFSKNGVVTVVEASETEVKVQFLEGRCVQNFLDTFDNIYINELNLGSYPTSLPPVTPTYPGDIEHGANEVVLPWVYEGTRMMQNGMVYIESGEIVWDLDAQATGKLSYQPYLIYITKKICQAVGYTFDFRQWEKSDDVNLLLCNTLPAAWNLPQYNRILPHWTLSEFFAELEKILVAEINIDHKAKHIDLSLHSRKNWDEKVVKLEDVVDTFSSEVAFEDDLCRFKGIANLRYSDRGDAQWAADQCQWLADLLKQGGTYYKEFASEAEFEGWKKNNIPDDVIIGKDDVRPQSSGTLYHCVKENTYYLWKVIIKHYPVNSSDYYTYTYSCEEVNRFGDVINSPESDNEIELSCVPVRIAHTDATHGYAMFLSPSGYTESADLDASGIRQPVAYSMLLKGEPDSSAEYYDKLYLAYWDGHSANTQFAELFEGKPYQLIPCPWANSRFSLRKRYAKYLSGLKVNPKERVKFSWISTSIPDVRAVYQIRGKRYLCEKITATFTETGMSQLLKGVFYPIVEET